MHFLVETFDADGVADLRAEIRPAHLRYLEDHVDIILAAGAKLTDDGGNAGGSAYLLDVPDRAAVEAFLVGEPFQQAGVIARTTITRWRRGFFDRQRVPQEGQ